MKPIQNHRRYSARLLGSFLALSSVVAIASWHKVNAQYAESLPLKLHKTENVTTSTVVDLKEKPEGDFVLRLDIYDADIADEGEIFVNGRKVIDLFGPYAKPEHDRKTIRLKVITPSEIWIKGRNFVTFARRGPTNGFDITGINTWSQASGDQSSQTQASLPDQPEQSDPKSETEQLVDNTFSGNEGTGQSEEPDDVERTDFSADGSGETTGSGLGGLLTKQAMVDMISRQHDVTPLPSLGNTSHCFRDQGRPTLPSNQQSSGCLSRNRKGNHFPGENTQNKENVNTWTALTSGFSSRTSAAARNVGVEFGPTMLAVRRNGQWTTFTAKAPCSGYLHPKGNVDRRVGGSPMRCTNNGNSAIAGIGQGSWKNPTHHHHGFGGRQWSTTPGSIDRVIAYMPARLVKINNNKLADFNTASQLWTAAVGTDSRSDQDRAVGKVSLRAMAHGQYKRLPSSGAWLPLVAHNLDMAEIDSLMRNRPPSIPFNTNSF